MKQKSAKLSLSVLLLVLLACVFAFSACQQQSAPASATVINEKITATIDLFEGNTVDVDLASNIKNAPADAEYTVTASGGITASAVKNGAVKITSNGSAGTYTANAQAVLGDGTVLSFSVEVTVLDSTPSVSLKTPLPEIAIDLNASNITVLHAGDLVEGTLPVGATLSVSAKDGAVSVSALDKNDFTVTANAVGEYVLEVSVDYLGSVLCSEKLTVKVTDSVADPTVKVADSTVEVEVVCLPTGKCEGFVVIDPTELFNTNPSVTYSAATENDGVRFTKQAGGKIRVDVGTLGTKEITVYAEKRGEKKAESKLTLVLNADASALAGKIDLFDGKTTQIDLSALLANSGVAFDISPSSDEISVAKSADGKLTVTSSGKAGEYTVSITGEKGGKNVVSLEISVSVFDSTPQISFLENPEITLDIGASDKLVLVTEVLADGPIVDGVTTEIVALSDGISVVAFGENQFFVFSRDTVGTYPIHIELKYRDKLIDTLDTAVTVVDSVPVPTARVTNIADTANVLLFPDGSCDGYVDIVLADVFDAHSAITYTATCENGGISYTVLQTGVMRIFVNEKSNKQIVISALKRGQAMAECTLDLTVNVNIPSQLANGDFEQGYLGWNMTDEEKAAYSIYGSPTDIWGNPVNANGSYLYGFTNEAFANAHFTSSLFTLGGNGMMTWKMAGNYTDNLTFVLMKYVEDGEDIEVARFGNWYFPESNLSGFIFHEYYYQVPSEYIGSKMYFAVNDAESAYFAFVNLDDIVTYYTDIPDISGMRPADRDAGGNPIVKKPTATESVLLATMPGGTYQGGVILTPSDFFVADSSVTYVAESADAGVFAYNLANGTVNVVITSAGTKTVNLYACSGGEKKAYATITLNAAVAEISNQLVNGNFELGYTAWNMTADERAAYSIYNSPTDLWGNPVGANGNYLYGFANEGFANAHFNSSLFVAGGCGIITWKIAGNYTENLNIALMKYVEGGEDVEIARFGNWFFPESGLSGFIFHSYYYQIPSEHIGSKMYFVVNDTESSYFAFVNLDDIVTYYAEVPDISGMFSADRAAAGNPIVKKPTAEKNATLAKMPDGTHQGYVIINPSELFSADASVTYVGESADGDVTVSTTADGQICVAMTGLGTKTVTVYACSGVERKASSIVTVNATGGVYSQLVNGDFEHGYIGWNMTADEKAAYSIYGSPTDIWGNPVGASGNYLYGFANEGFANAHFNSSLFTASGSGVITWKMAGNCTDNLSLVLMKHVEDGTDVEVARFNNWYFGTVAESGFIFHSYYYRIPEEYMGSEMYFVVNDTASANFAFVCLDDMVTYHEAAPDTSAMLKGGFCTRPE